MSKSTSQLQVCFHCGDAINAAVKFNDKVFCCDGCKTVHQVLSENGMEAYYNLSAAPGNKVLFSDNEEFAYLDTPEIADLLVDFKNDNLIKLSLQIPGIHCSSCIWLLENLHLLHKGIHHSRVDFLKKEFTANIDPNKITVRQLADLLNAIGYKPSITLESKQKRKSNQTNTTLLLKLSVAGFCFGNIMLFSFPEYFGLNIKEDQDFAKFFSYFNLILSIPVLFYSASDYFVSAFKAIRKKVIHINVPLALGMVALFGRSFYEIVWHVGPGYFDSFAGLIFFLLAGKWFQNYTYDHLSFDRDYKSYFPLSVNVKVGENWTNKLLTEVKKGDRLKIKNGDLIAADAIVLNGEAYIDYSFVTGESLPVHKVLGEMVYGGGRQMGGTIEIEITKEVSQSQLTKIWNSQKDNEQESRLQSFSEKVSKYFTIVLLAIAFISLGVWSFIDISTGFFAFTSVLIVACPCALALSSPLALGNTLRLLGNKGLYLKNANVVEQLAKVNHIVFDKTGTLTQANQFEVIWQGESLTHAQIAGIKGLVSHSNHPYSVAIYNHIVDAPSVVNYFKEITGSGIVGQINGIGEIKLGSANFCSCYQELASGVYLAINNQVLGYFQIKSKYRTFMSGLLTSLGKKYKISVLSGDSKREAEPLLNTYNGFTNIHFQQTPQDKKTRIEQLEQKGDVVMMVGDGLNDAGALLSSDAGIVVAENSAQFTPAAKGIIMADDLNNFDRMLALTERTLLTIKQSFAISILYNIVGIYFAVQGMLSPVFAAILMPLSSITVVLFNTLLTNYWAIKLKLK